jgi:hypothetical protein
MAAIYLDCTDEEFHDIHESVDKYLKRKYPNATVDKEALNKLLMDHSKIIRELRSKGIIILHRSKQPDKPKPPRKPRAPKAVPVPSAPTAPKKTRQPRKSSV